MPWFKMCKRGAIMARHFSFIWETSYTTLAKISAQLLPALSRMPPPSHGV
jgi:hypothetical protein